MRAIDRDFTNAVNREQQKSFGNTYVKVCRLEGKTYTSVYLHGHKVAFMRRNECGVVEEWYIDNCGWCTNVATARMDAFMRMCLGFTNVSVKKRGGEHHWFYLGRDMGGFGTLTKADYYKAVSEIGGAK